jgi:hypothetical protein
MPARFVFLILAICALCAALIGPSAVAQSSKQHLIAPTQPPRPLPLPVVMPPLISVPDAETPIELRRLRLSSEISGGLAQTTVEMVFFNPNRRNLEGNLAFPLLDGQQISGFALDVEGKLRAAVPVEKAKGQQIFEAVERQRVDPGLLEATEGNNFKLRIYPIPPKGTRTVQIKYTEALTRQGKNWAFRLPLAYGTRWQDFELDLNLHDAGANSGASPAASPVVTGAIRELAFAKLGQQYQAHWRKADFVAKGELNLLIPAALTPRVYTQKRDDETWFLAEVPVDASRAARRLPKRLGLLWDSSHSGSKRNPDAEMQELDRYFKAIGNLTVRLTRLADVAEDGGEFSIVNGNWASLRAALQKTVYDGASNLTSWQPQSGIDEYLIVSDGLHNYGATPFPTLLPGQRLNAMNSAQEADAARLAAWAEGAGGKLVQINPQKPGEAAARLLSEGVHVDQFDASGARELQIEAHAAQNGLLRIAGKLTGPKASLNLSLSGGAAAAGGEGKSRKLTINLAESAGSHPFAANLWAAWRLRALGADYELHRGEIRRIGQQFGLPTRETSLLVLETVADYVRFEVTPPPELLAQYQSMQQSRSVALAGERKKHVDYVFNLFEQKQAWWNKNFPKDKVPPPVEDKKDLARVAELRASGERRRDANATRVAEAVVVAEHAPPPPRPAAPAPAPVAQAPASEAPGVQAVRVQGAAKAKRAGHNEGAAGTRGVISDAEEAAPTIGISLKKWSSDAPYLTRLAKAAPDKIYAQYLDEKPSWNNSSAFYLDVADILFEKNQGQLGLRVLSNLAELELENRALLRILAYRLLQADAPKQAIFVLEKVARLAPEEPQSWRDLGLAYAANQQWQAALDNLNQVIERTWDSRFAEIETIVLADMNALLAKAEAKAAGKLDTSRIDPRLLKNLPLDLRVVMTWDADNADMDLWVTDPNGERCFYGHPLTYQGARMSRDFTRGYGPEEFSLKKAKPGKYKIEANYYGNSQQVLAGATTLQVNLTTAFGSPAQKEQTLTLRLKDRQETVLVGEFEVK